MVLKLLKKSPKVTTRHFKRKVLLIGDGAVGKTSLVRKFVTDKFDDKYIATIGTKVTKKELDIKGQGQNILLTLMIWDVLGQKGYKTVQSASFKGADGVILVCDFTRVETLRSLEEYWLPNIGTNIKKLNSVFVANKSDLKTEAQFSFEDLQNIAVKYDSRAYTSSAKTGENVEQLFLTLGKTLINIETKEEIKVSITPEDMPKEMSVVDATDLIINDFCKSFGDMEVAMPVIRKQFTKAGVDITNPTIEGLSEVINLLALVERDFNDERTTQENKSRRYLMLKRVKD
ncbi:MAG: GTP-binding protein [Methanomassiliicoccales archaeon]|nr:MAG: GTP-binding protein [Methanomassiliicoccales archaeon]